MNTVTPGTTITLSLALSDERTPANNPITGATCEVSLRRLSDDAWWDFENSEWDAVAFGSRTSDHKGALTDKGDGTYERDWNQASADASAERTYLAYFLVTAADDPNFVNRDAHELWRFAGSDAVGARTVTFLVRDAALTPIQGATVVVRASAGGGNIRSLTTASNGRVSTLLDDGTYYHQAVATGFATSTEASFVVDDDESVTITLAAGVITSPSVLGACKVWAYPRQISGAVNAETDAPLFSVSPTRSALTDEGVLVQEHVAATRDATYGYWYVEVTPVENLAAADGSGETLSYVWTLRNGETLRRSVNVADGATANLIADLD